MNYVKIVMAKALKKPEWDIVKNEVESMEKLVGGPLEVIRTSVKGVVIVSDDEAKIYHKQFNFITETETIAGDAFFVGIDGERFIDLTEEQAEKVMSLYFPGTRLPYKCLSMIPIEK